MVEETKAVMPMSMGGIRESLATRQISLVLKNVLQLCTESRGSAIRLDIRSLGSKA